MALTAKQQTFVGEYLIDLNATQAAIRAGYSSKTAASIGDENLKKPEIQKVIKEAMGERSQRTEVSQDYVIEGILRTIKRCEQAQPVLDKDGAPTGEYRFDATNVLKGLALLGKHLGMFTNKVELEVNEKLAVRLQRARERVSSVNRPQVCIDLEGHETRQFT